MTYQYRIPGYSDDYAMPIFVVRGAADGPTLLTLTGILGDEFEPMAAVQDAFGELNPKDVTGTWLCIVRLLLARIVL